MDQQVFRLTPELRRCAIYAIVGGVLIALVAAGVGHYIERPEGLVPAAAVGLIVPLLMVLALRWRIRVDDAGLAALRWGLVWDVWPWTDFATGRINKVEGLTLVDPARPWWRRKLHVGQLSSADAKTVMQLVNSHYVPPPPEPLPTLLRIKWGLFNSAEFNEAGLSLKDRSGVTNYAWSDVQRVHITRADPVRRDFEVLEVVLPGRELELRKIVNWFGATAAQLNDYLLDKVPSERVDVDILGERPSRACDVLKKLDQVLKQQREFHTLVWTFAVLCVLPLLPVVFGEPFWKCLAMTAVLALMVTCGLIVIAKGIRAKKKELTELLNTYPTTDKA